jgi:hypothetical protein
MFMANNDIFNQFHKTFHQITKSFYQTYRITGTVRMKFGVRAIADSDGNSVVEVYLTPMDLESANSLLVDENGKHMQFLENMVPACILGYQYVLQIIPEGEQDIRLELMNIIEPVAY